MFIRTEGSIKNFTRAYPIVTTIILINVIVWFFTVFLTNELSYRLFLFGVGNNYAIYAHQEYWRLITPVFMHADLMHLLFNCFSLVIFGPGLERMIGKFKFSIGYLGAGILANVGTYIVNPASIQFQVGASGAIYGLFGVYIFIIFFRKYLMTERDMQIVLIILIIGIISTFITPNVSRTGHIFGLIAGLGLAPPLLTRAQPFDVVPPVAVERRGTYYRRRRISQATIKRILWIVIGGLVILGLIGRFL